MGWGKAGRDYAILAIRGVLGVLFRALGATPNNWASRVSMKVDSDQERENYTWLGEAPIFRRWIGSRLARGMKVFRYAIENFLFEATLSVDIEDFRFDKLGQIKIRAAEMGRQGDRHWLKLISTLIEANDVCYDGKAFFAVDHQFSPASGAMSNLLAVGDLPALQVGAGGPDEDQMRDVILGLIAHTFTYKDVNGEPANEDATEFLVMVPTQLTKAMNGALKNMLNNQGGSNSAMVQGWKIEGVTNPRLTSPTRVYVFRVDSQIKPFIEQEAIAPQVDFLGPGSDTAFNENQYKFGAKTLRNAGYGEFLFAIAGDLS